MGWLVGLPLGLFRLLGSILLVALRFAVPILILVAVILVVRHVRRRSAGTGRRTRTGRSRNFTALCIRWIMRRSRTPRTRRRTRATEWNSSTWRHRPAGPADPQAGLVPPVAVVLLPWGRRRRSLSPSCPGGRGRPLRNASGRRESKTRRIRDALLEEKRGSLGYGARETAHLDSGEPQPPPPTGRRGRSQGRRRQRRSRRRLP